VDAHAFVLVLTCGAALLALWILMRFVNFGPRSVVWAVVHIVLACVILRVVPYALEAGNTSSVPAARYINVFVLALPAFVYAFLSGGWVARLAMGMLRR
jgi:hypothetical protein